MAFVLRPVDAPQDVGMGFFNTRAVLDRLRERPCSDRPKVAESKQRAVATLIDYAQRQQGWAPAPAGEPAYIDMIATLKLMVLGAVPNPNSRAEIARAVLAEEGQQALTARGQQAAGEEDQAFPLEPAVWAAMFDMMALPPHNYSTLHQSVVLRQDYMFADSRTHKRRPPNMVAFSDFYQFVLERLETQYAVDQAMIQRVRGDIVMLFFAAVCLRSRGSLLDDLLALRPRFACLEEYEILPLHKGDRATTLRAALLTLINTWATNWRPAEVSAGNLDFRNRVDPLERSIESVLLALCPDPVLPAKVLRSAAAEQAETPPPVPPREEEEEAAETPGEPAEPAAPGAAEPETAQARIAALVGAKACPTHNGARQACACPTQCIAARLGAPHVRPAGSADALLSQTSVRFATARAGRERGVAAMIGTAMLGDRAAALMPVLTGGALNATAVRPHTVSEWGSVLHAFDGARAPASADLAGVDALARTAGWHDATPAVRAKRYVAAYSGEDLASITREAGLPALTSAQRTAVAAYRARNPAPAPRTVQTLMHLAGRDQ